MILSRLPIGKSAFTLLRHQNLVYVDKRATLMELFRLGFDRVWFTRPRRFGKSLLLSTLASLFCDGLKHFHGLAAQKKPGKTKPMASLSWIFSVTIPVKKADEFRLHFPLPVASGFLSFGILCDH